MLLASIPSPSDPFIFHLGPLAPRWYGLLLALGILVGILVARRELARRGLDPDLAYDVALWVVPFGVVGARLYHVATDWSAFAGHRGDIPQVREGGLGIYGAMFGGAIGAAIGARRYGSRCPCCSTASRPGAAFAQALGRFGNYFNQELFGGPTHLPWGLEIDPAQPPGGVHAVRDLPPDVPVRVALGLIVLAILLRVARALAAAAAGLRAPLYLALYSLGRFFVEGLRIDPAHEIGPLRLNQVVAAVVFVVARRVVCSLRRGGPPRLRRASALGARRLARGRRARRDDHAHGAAAAGRRLERERAADAGGALAHRVDAAVHAAALRARRSMRRARRRRPRTRCRRPRAWARHLDARAAGVLDGVRERLLRDPVEADLRLPVELVDARPPRPRLDLCASERWPAARRRRR